MKTHNLETIPPKVVTIVVQTPGQNDLEIENSLLELAELLKTLGAEVCAAIIQKRPTFSRSQYLGKGKLLELKEIAEEKGAEYIVADDELSSLQIKTIEKMTGLPVKDRTSIILDIFASHATTSEGKLQIELAMHQYQLPRLLRIWPHLERQRGGIGLKGPGETQLETDRRILNQKIKKLREELEKVAKTRALQGKKRNEEYAPLFSLVGYTNAGKSTLINQLSGSDVKICDGLFTTLDPTSRRVELPNELWCIVSDTVGFIRKLPHTLVEAFRATLESVVESEILLLVVDASDPSCKEHIRAVELVLNEIGAGEHERLYVFNKTDKQSAFPYSLLDELYPNNVKISAATGENINELKDKMAQIIKRNRATIEIILPVSSKMLGEFMKHGIIVSQKWDEKNVTIKAELPKSFLSKNNLWQFAVS